MKGKRKNSVWKVKPFVVYLGELTFCDRSFFFFLHFPRFSVQNFQIAGLATLFLQPSVFYQNFYLQKFLGTPSGLPQLLICRCYLHAPPQNIRVFFFVFLSQPQICPKIHKKNQIFYIFLQLLLLQKLFLNTCFLEFHYLGLK